ncbi:MAG TPA: hypothetical protein VK509_11580 [Polyangiales bacterium]|nr:hypothetical protein [Polyangiales bacterium]
MRRVPAAPAEASALASAFGLAVALALSACAAPRPVAPARAQVRLDVAARALARARAQYEAACSPAAGCERSVPPWLHVGATLEDAELWLDAAQSAADAWVAGDGRRYTVVRPCLAQQLNLVADALIAAQQIEPPGLRAALAPATDCELQQAP